MSAYKYCGAAAGLDELYLLFNGHCLTHFLLCGSPNVPWLIGHMDTHKFV